ncbi:MAG: hypothetical protein J2P47_05740 [Acetobacteraceae bacterium]|nr:hypothetical protein [Acetobacteraceae bacterium]
MTAVTFTLKSANSKVGPIPVSTTDRTSCPDTCPFLKNGCYFDQFRNAVYWDKLTAAGPNSSFANGRSQVRTLSWDAFVGMVAALPAGQLWRHDQGGDLPHRNGRIERDKVDALVTANRGKKGFTYTHHNVADNANADVVRRANRDGFTVNVSANGLAHADTLADLDVGPVVTVLPHDVRGNVKIFTPAGRRVVVCPQTYRDELTCAKCGLCAIRDRKVIVGFPGHGAGKARVTSVARAHDAAKTTPAFQG